MRRLAFLSLCALATAAGSACASRRGATPAPTDGAGMPTTTRIETPNGAVALTTVPSTRTARLTVDAPVDSVWKALVPVYQALEIPVTTLLSDQRLVANEAFKVRRRLHGQPLSRYLECGSSMGMQNADTYAVTMSIRTQLVGDPTGGTSVLTRVQATGVAPTFSNSAVSCASTGALEQQITDLLAQRMRQ